MRRSGVALVLVVLLAGCAPWFGDDDAPSPRERIVVYGAASLRDVLDELRSAYAEVQPGVEIERSTDASSSLATQILEGAPADVFLSADTDNPKRLVDAGLVDGGAVSVAGNELVVITPLDDPAGIASPADLARDGVAIVAAGPTVPITRYADEFVARFAGLPDAPSDFAARYAGNVVSREDSVKAIVAKIELGEADAGIVYRTDAAAADGVRLIPVPEGSQVRAEYAGVVLAGSPRRAAARAFLDWVRGPDGQAILAAAGFLPRA